MRVTNKMLTNTFLRDMQTNLKNMQTIQMQRTTGKKYSRPSDDPGKVTQIMQVYTDETANKQYNTNISNAISWTKGTDTSLGQAGNVLTRIQELLVSAGNAAYGTQERKSIKDEINQKISEFAQDLNSTYDGKYIFGGTKNDVKPLTTIANGAASIGAVTNLNSLGGAGTVGGTFTGTVDTTYQVKITGLDSAGKLTNMQYSTDGGNTWSTDVAAGGDIGNGLTFNVATSTTNKTGDVLTFTATAKNDNKNTKLIYYSGSDTNPELTTPPSGTATTGYNEFNQIANKMQIEVSQGVTVQYNVSANDVLRFKSSNGTTLDLRDVFSKIVNHLDGKSDDGSTTDSTSASKLVGDDLQNVKDSINSLLSIRSAVGAKQNAMESAENKNTNEYDNMEELLSKIEDVDITEVTMQYATLQTIYQASLQTSAKVLQPSLMDYLR